MRPRIIVFFAIISVAGGIALLYRPTSLSQKSTVIIGSQSGTAVRIISPERKLQGASDTATISYQNDDGSTVTLPYIQTSNTLTLTVNAPETLTPRPTNLKIVLAGPVTRTTVIPTESAQVSFAHLPKGDYTATVTAIDGFGNTLATPALTDTITHLGIGDIVAVLGASIAEGICGSPAICTYPSSVAPTITSRIFPEYGASTHRYWNGFEGILADELATGENYPIYVLNAGYGGATTAYYQTYMNTIPWEKRMLALSPNVWLIQDMPINDVIHEGAIPPDANAVTTNLAAIIKKLMTTYHADKNTIFLATPSYAPGYPAVAQYVPVMANIATTLGVREGPDFWDYFRVYGAENHLFGPDTLHLSLGGNAAMADQWANILLGHATPPPLLPGPTPAP